MSSIGKIFVILNLVLSAAFVGWAASALGKTDDMQQKVEAAEKAKEEAIKAKDADISKLGVEKNEVVESQRSFREERDQLKITADRLQGQIEEEKRRNDTLSQQLTKIQATLNDYNQTIAQLTQDKDHAVERAHEAEKARDGAQDTAQKAELAKRDATDAQKKAEARIAELEAAQVAMNDKLSSAETRLQVAASQGVSTLDAQPLIQGSVLSVRFDKNGGPGLVMLNVGKKNEVKPGYTFQIYRGSTYKGQVRVEDVQDSICSAVIIGGPNQTAIAQGDSATTNL